ncbi:MAG: peptidase S16 [Chitinophaga sp.]|jgi:uncharacterized protein|nr:peptidase S16 [Chitinophaga sp.]
MTNFIPVFPLNLVVYPGESLNLHIFEPRYKQLINECFVEKKLFGIPVVIENNLTDLGTLIAIKEIVKVYEDGRMDVKTEGIKIFKVLETIQSIPDKLYAGAIVSYPANNAVTNKKLMPNVLSSIRQFHSMLNVQKVFKKADDELLSYDVAHHAGLNIQEEYELLGLFNEEQRLEYLRRHLKKIINVAGSIESLKQRIQLNGHFKELKGFNFGT